VQDHPRLALLLERSARSLRTLQEHPRSNPLREHAILIGYGRVGSVIGEALALQRLPFVVIDSDLKLVENLRARGIRAIYGDASAPGVLDMADVSHARLLVIASPDGFQTRRILELARARNPRIDTVVRTHSNHELSYLESQGVGMAVMGEREMALGMAAYALKSLGLSEDKSRLLIQSSRNR
jgi:CPA2 family monovalent cation:H+ antiporter-2